MRQNNLTFVELAMLHVLAQHTSNPPTTRALSELTNQWLNDNQVPPGFTWHVTSKAQVSEAMSKFQELGLVTRPGRRESAALLPAGQELLRRIGSDWREWPIAIPIVNGRLKMTGAQHVPKPLLRALSSK